MAIGLLKLLNSPLLSTTWEQRKLGEIAEIVGGGTPNTSVEEYWDGDIDWYTPAELGDRRYVDSSLRKITQAGYDNSSARMLPFFRQLDSLIALHQRERNIAISASQVASHAQKLQLTRNNLFELSDLLLILVYELLHLGQVDFFLFFKSVDVTRNVQIVIVFLDLF